MLGNNPVKFCVVRKLVGSGCLNRTCVCASAALDALVCVDLVLAVAFNNSAYRASIYTSAARNASVGNLVCHTYVPPLDLLYIHFNT